MTKTKASLPTGVTSIASPGLAITSGALDRLAHYYGDIDRLRAASGSAYLTPERVVERVIDVLVDPKGISVHWCIGYGKEAPPHFWNLPGHPGGREFESRCDQHPERRKSERRRP